MMKQSVASLSISQSQVIELAEKYLLIKNKIVLRDHLTVTRSPDGWHIAAKTTPVMLGKSTEFIQFTINEDTGDISMPTIQFT
jgi:hypothetical protein